MIFLNLFFKNLLGIKISEGDLNKNISIKKEIPDQKIKELIDEKIYKLRLFENDNNERIKFDITEKDNLKDIERNIQVVKKTLEDLTNEIEGGSKTKTTTKTQKKSSIKFGQTKEKKEKKIPIIKKQLENKIIEEPKQNNIIEYMKQNHVSELQKKRNANERFAKDLLESEYDLLQKELQDFKAIYDSLDDVNFLYENEFFIKSYN